ncbi:MAG: peptidoglycan-binding protein, partial [Saprospiraceae bacterium]|nr:peptidoglycan-binding protein [Saprospiraceae bacterium]
MGTSFSNKRNIIGSTIIVLVLGFGLSYMNCGQTISQNESETEANLLKGQDKVDQTRTESDSAAFVPLSVGMTHPDVLLLEQFLVEHKYLRTKPDMVFDRDTMEAVQYLQKDLGFEPTGSIDQNWKPTNPKVEQGLPKSPLACDADFNQDGVINVLDFLILLQGYFTQNLNVDLDQNQVVDIVDVYIFILLFGQEPECACNWQQEAYIKAPNAEFSDMFGVSLSLHQNTLVVGAKDEDSNQTFVTNGAGASSNNSMQASGAAYVFVRNGNTWTNEAYLKASNANAVDLFGDAVAIDGDTIVVGALGEDSNSTSIINGSSSSPDNSAQGAGAVYVFKRNGNTWAQEAYLKAANANGNDMFGWSVSIHQDTIAVGAPGEDSSQTAITNGQTASTDNSKGDAGAVYIFKRNGTIWTQEAYIKASNANIQDHFGHSVSVHGDTLVVTQPGDDNPQPGIMNGQTSLDPNASDNEGAVFVYKRNGTTWTQESYIKASNPSSFDYL